MKTENYFLKIKTSGEIALVNAQNSLKALQKIVDGYIEVVKSDLLPEGAVLICDEEGKIKEKAVNLVASELYDSDDDFICGDVAIAKVDSEDITGFGLKEAYKINDEIAKILLKRGYKENE